ncbi:MAG: hypothetical protein ACK58L_08370 [Planctomycetota bacterium]
MNVSDSNPYAAPDEPPDSSWRLPPDTEFLFNEECILSIGTLELPRICILTGERLRLITMNSTFSAIPEGYRKAFALLIVGSILSFLVPSLLDSAVVVAEQRMMLPMILALVAPVVIIAGIRKRHRLDLSWFVSETALVRIESERRRWRLISIACGLFLVLVSVAFRILMDFDVAMILILLFGVTMGSRKNLLKSKGAYQGLVIVKGFKPAFFEELRRLTQRDDSKIG